MQEKETTNNCDFTDVFNAPKKGRIIALDLGMKKIGVAISDELQITVRPLTVIKRTAWKKVLKQINDYIENFDAVALVLGLPLEFEGGESEMTIEARRLAKNFSLSIKSPYFFKMKEFRHMKRVEIFGNQARMKKKSAKLWMPKPPRLFCVILSNKINRSADGSSPSNTINFIRGRAVRAPVYKPNRQSKKISLFPARQMQPNLRVYLFRLSRAFYQFRAVLPDLRLPFLKLQHT